MAGTSKNSGGGDGGKKGAGTPNASGTSGGGNSGGKGAARGGGKGPTGTGANTKKASGQQKKPGEVNDDAAEGEEQDDENA